MQTLGRRAAARRFEVGLLVVGAVLLGRSTTLLAQLNLTAAGSAGVGVTDNAGSNSTDTAGAQRGELVLIGGSFGGLWTGRAQSHSLQYTASFARIFGTSDRNTQTHGLSWTGSYAPSATLTFSGTTSASYSRFDAISIAPPSPTSSDGTVVTAMPVDPFAAAPIPSATNAFVSGSAHLTTSYRPTPMVSWTETTSGHMGRPLGAVGRPSYGLDQAIAYGHAFGLDSLLGNAQVGYLTAAELRDSLGNVVYPENRTIHGRVLIGWGRNVTPNINGNVNVGGLGAMDFAGGPIVVGPSWRLAATYTQELGSISVDIDRAPAPSLYIGRMSVSDRVGVNLTLPLDRAQRFHLTGAGSYNHARVMDTSNHLVPSSNSLALTTGVTFRPLLWPVSFSLHYTRMQQTGYSISTNTPPLPTVERQTLMLTINGSWARYPSGAEGSP